jgi:hypothetical protein
MKRAFILATVVVLCLATLLTAAPATAQSGNTWQVDFFPNLDWAGSPVYTIWASLIAFNWGTNSPAPGMPADNWTARMTTNAFFYAGLYRFTVQADDEVVLTVGGVTYLNTLNQGQSGRTFTLDIPLVQGNQFIQLDYREYTGTAYVYLNWQLISSSSPQPMPPMATPPPTSSNPPPGTVPVASPSSVVTQYGDYTPCIQQGIHQSNCFQSNGAWNAPNMGSIEMEPQIVVWGNCVSDQVVTMQLYVNTAPQPAKCSKTEAGWYPI